MQITVIGTAPDVVEDSFTVSNNENWVRDYQLTNNNDPVLIPSDWKFFMHMKDKSGLLVVDASSDNSMIVVTDRDLGKIGFRINQSQASQVAPGSYDYDIILVASEVIYRLAKGTITVDQGITSIPGQEKWSRFPLISRP